MRMDRIVIPRWFNRHLHLRDVDDGMLNLVLPYTLDQRATGAVIIGNLKHPNETSTFDKALAYKERILAALPPGSDFKPRMTCYLTDETTPEEVLRGYDFGLWCAVKLCLTDKNGKGGTTGAQHGVRNLLRRYSVFEMMQRERISLLGHLEVAEEDVDEYDREARSLDRDLIPLLEVFPALRVVVEHVTDGRMADFVAQAPYDIHATVTPHHLVANRNAMYWGGMNPINYCRPVLKSEEHRLRVRKYVTGGHPRFGAGTDSAPHDEEAKTRVRGNAGGIFHPKPVEIYTMVFDQDDKMEHLDSFLSRNFLGIYGMNVSQETMVLERRPCTIPLKVGNVWAFMGGMELPWTLIG